MLHFAPAAPALSRFPEHLLASPRSPREPRRAPADELVAVVPGDPREAGNERVAEL